MDLAQNVAPSPLQPDTSSQGAGSHVGLLEQGVKAAEPATVPTAATSGPPASIVQPSLPVPAAQQPQQAAQPSPSRPAPPHPQLQGPRPGALPPVQRIISSPAAASRLEQQFPAGPSSSSAAATPSPATLVVQQAATPVAWRGPPQEAPLLDWGPAGFGHPTAPPPADPALFTLSDRKVRLTEEEDPSLYSLLRRWVQNDPEAEVDAANPEGPPAQMQLPPPLPAAEEAQRDAPREDSLFDEEPEQGQAPIELLLEHHKDHWVTVRQHHQRARDRTLQRYQARLALLLPSLPAPAAAPTAMEVQS